MFEHANDFIVKVTRGCNLRCKYCYVADKDSFTGEVMSFDIFKKLVDRIILDKHKGPENPKKIHFIFHGGEPLTIGHEILSKYVSYVHNAFTLAKLNFSLGVQTNATLIDEEFCLLFKDYDIGVGLSFDGGFSTSNQARTSLTTSKYLEKLALLEEYKIHYGILNIITTQNIDFMVQNIKFYKEQLKHFSGKFNYVEDVLNIGGLEIPGEVFFEKCKLPLIREYCSVLDGVAPSKILKDSLIETYLSTLFNIFIFKTDPFGIRNENNHGNCNIKFCGTGLNVIEISPTGDINYCGRYHKDEGDSIIHNLADSDFLATQTRKKVYERMLIKHKLILENHCDTCFAGDICDYGCLAFSWVKFNQYKIRTELVCDYYKPLKKYLVKNLGRVWNAWFLNNCFPDKTAFFPSEVEVSEQRCKKAQEILNQIQQEKKYQVTLDENFKSNDQKCYQFKIKEILNINEG